MQGDEILSEAWMVIDGEAYDEDGNVIPLNNKKVCGPSCVDAPNFRRSLLWELLID